MQGGMTIGKLAKAARVNVETIRYYQRRGLVGEPRKPPGGQRRYSPEVIARIGFIRRAQQLGFSLAEVKDLLQYSEGGGKREVRAIAQRKHDTLETHIAHLEAMRDRLRSLIAASKKAGGRDASPIIAALNTPD
jgi:MerR family mercuric resistance operon transcriptional regulator